MANFFLDFGNRTTSADHLHAVGLPSCDGEVTGAHTLVKSESLSFEPALGRVPTHFATLRTRQRNSRVEVEEKREMRLSFAAHESIETTNRGFSKLAAVALISERGVIEAVTHHQLAPGKRRPHDFFQVLGSRRVDQRQFGEWRYAAGFRGEQDGADLLSQLRPAWLTSHHDPTAAVAKVLHQQTHLCALARSVDAFERDEDAALFQIFRMSCARIRIMNDSIQGSRATRRAMVQWRRL